MILLGLGSNLGAREDFLAQARLALEAFDITVTAVSSVIETPALLPPGAPADWDMPFLNQVVAIETHHAPEDILSCLKHIERELGRKPHDRWAPREIDLDLLCYHDTILISDPLTVPHPHMDTRPFVLKPLMEIAPDWHHPVLDKTARDLLAELSA